jgi:hypothetical protein
VVSVTIPYGRILVFLDRLKGLYLHRIKTRLKHTHISMHIVEFEPRHSATGQPLRAAPSFTIRFIITTVQKQYGSCSNDHE